MLLKNASLAKHKEPQCYKRYGLKTSTSEEVGQECLHFFTTSQSLSPKMAKTAVQSEARKIMLPKYGIRELKAKNFELATLIHVISTAERNRFVA